jgi:hypothetical protein
MTFTLSASPQLPDIQIIHAVTNFVADMYSTMYPLVKGITHLFSPRPKDAATYTESLSNQRKIARNLHSELVNLIPRASHSFELVVSETNA